MVWGTFTAPRGLTEAMTVRAQPIPAHHLFREHAHRWHQVAYAVFGVLTVAVAGSSFVILPKQAARLPSGLAHGAGSLFGTEFRSFWIADEAGARPPRSRQSSISRHCSKP
jgi:hypothetical protein